MDIFSKPRQSTTIKKDGTTTIRYTDGTVLTLDKTKKIISLK